MLENGLNPDPDSGVSGFGFRFLTGSGFIEYRIAPKHCWKLKTFTVRNMVWFDSRSFRFRSPLEAGPDFVIWLSRNQLLWYITRWRAGGDRQPGQDGQAVDQGPPPRHHPQGSQARHLVLPVQPSWQVAIPYDRSFGESFFYLLYNILQWLLSSVFFLGMHRISGW